METADRIRTRPGWLLGGLSLLMLGLLFELARHPETSALLRAALSPTELACTLSCLGHGPFVQVLAESTRALLLILLFHHQKSRDPLKSLGIAFLSDLLVLFPISRFLKKSYTLKSEMAADAQALRDRADPIDLVGSLLKAQKASGPMASWFSDPTSDRVKYLLGQRPDGQRARVRVFLSAVVLAVLVFVAWAPVHNSLSGMSAHRHETCGFPSGPK